MSERIVAVALNVGGNVVWGVDGERHSDVIFRYHQASGGRVASNEQGFLTNDGRFVDREEAAQIAYEAGQMSSQKEKLLSEDVW